MRVSIPKAEQSSEYELAFPGSYPARVEKWVKKTGPKGDYIQWSFSLQNVQQNAEGMPLKGRVGNVFDNTTLIEGQRWRLANLAKAAGCNPDNMDLDEFVGRTVMVEIDVKKDPGFPPKNEIKKYSKA